MIQKFKAQSIDKLNLKKKTNPQIVMTDKNWLEPKMAMTDNNNWQEHIETLYKYYE